MLVMGMRGQLADTLVEEEDDYEEEEKDVSGGDISEDRNNDDGDAVSNEIRTDLRPKESRQSDAGPRTFLSEYCLQIVGGRY